MHSCAQVWRLRPAPASAPDAPICPIAQRNTHINPAIFVQLSCSCCYIVVFSRTSTALLPSPLGKTLFLATVAVDPCGAWAFCSPSDHGNILFYCRFHDPSPYLPVLASVFLLDLVTLGN